MMDLGFADDEISTGYASSPLWGCQVWEKIEVNEGLAGNYRESVSWLERLDLSTVAESNRWRRLCGQKPAAARSWRIAVKTGTVPGYCLATGSPQVGKELG
jgi:hypothetical protein